MDPALWLESSGERIFRHVWNGEPGKRLRLSAFLSHIIGKEDNNYGYRYACSPVLFGPICEDKKKVEFRKQKFGLYKSSPIPMSQVMAVMDHAGVDKAVLLAEDYSAEMGQPIITNEEVKQLVDLEPDRFIGFASVDPRGLRR